jgi:hypothetical protein
MEVATSDWFMACHVHEGQHSYGLDSIAASNQFSSNLPRKTSEPEQALAEYNRPWTSAILMQSTDMTGTYRSTYQGSQPAVPPMTVPVIPAMENLRHWTLLSSETGAESSTVVPAQTMVDVEAATSEGSFQDSSFSSPIRRTLEDSVSFRSIKQESEKNEFETSCIDYFDESLSPTYRATRDDSNIEAKDAKRLHRSARIAKRRTRTELQSAELIKILPTGKRHECYFTWANGTSCKKKFQRVEHLRRHIFTHTGGPYVYCPVPECKKNTEGFGGGRKDNLRQHFKTHLRQTTTSRNDHRSFEEFYALLRQAFPEEEAQKSIAKLEEWRSDGGHLKSENGSVGKNRGDSWRIRE